MIEYRIKVSLANQHEAKYFEWHSIHSLQYVNIIDFFTFDNFDFRIDGVVYQEYSPEFQHALDKHRSWAMLKTQTATTF